MKEQRQRTATLIRYTISDARYQALRQEIIETHRSSSDFLKWKLFAVAAVASVALGLLGSGNASSRPDARLIVCLAPLVCAYADLVNTDLAVRVMVIGNFLRLCGDPYETHISVIRSRSHQPEQEALPRPEPGDPRRDRRLDPFNAATIASFTASLAINVLIIFGGLWGDNADWSTAHANAFIGSGSVGVMTTLYLWWLYGARLDQTSIRDEDLPARPPAINLSRDEWPG